MDEQSIMIYVEEKNVEYSTLPHQDVLSSLYHTEYVEMEDARTTLFKKRLDYFVLANSLKEAMLSQTGYKQLKRYFLNEIGMDDREAKLAADKYNKACRAYKNLGTIIRNIASQPKLDIRDLTIKELQLAVREDWVRRRSALIPGERKDIAVESTGGNEIDWGSVHESAHQIYTSEWFQKAKEDPNAVAHIMTELTGRVVRQSEYLSR